MRPWQWGTASSCKWDIQLGLLVHLSSVKIVSRTLLNREVKCALQQAIAVLGNPISLWPLFCYNPALHVTNYPDDNAVSNPAFVFSIFKGALEVATNWPRPPHNTWAKFLIDRSSGHFCRSQISKGSWKSRNCKHKIVVASSAGLKIEMWSFWGFILRIEQNP